MKNNEGKHANLVFSYKTTCLGPSFDETVAQWISTLPKFSSFAKLFEGVEWGTFKRFTLQDLHKRGLPMHACVPLHKCLNMRKEEHAPRESKCMESLTQPQQEEHSESKWMESLTRPPVKVGNSEIRQQDVKGLVIEKVRAHLPGTRNWVFDEVKSWASTGTERLFWLMGGAGTGKSVVSAKLLELMGEQVVAFHFCRHDNPAASSPVALLSSLAAQLCACLPGFAEQLGRSTSVDEALQSGHVEKVFEHLIAVPLGQLTAEKTAVIVLDALDELPQDGIQAVLNLLADKLILLPPFLKLFVTSRDEPRIRQALTKFKPLELQVDEERNRQDLRAFLAHVARDHVKMEMSSTDIEKQVKQKFPDIAIEGKLHVLEEPMRKGRQAYELVAEALANEPGFRELCSIPEVRPKPMPCQQLSSLGPPIDALYTDAAEAHGLLTAVVASHWTEYKRIGDTVLKVPVAGAAKPWVYNAIDPGLKGKARALQKANNDCNGDVTQLRDIARQTIECSRCDQMVEGLNELKKAGVEIIQLKNKYANPTPMGYRDLNLNVAIPLADGRKHLGEVQLNLHKMLLAKDLAHEHYEVSPSYHVNLQFLTSRLCEPHCPRSARVAKSTRTIWRPS